MSWPHGGDPGLDRLLGEAELLHERLHRVTVALAITEDLLADTFEELADRTLDAKRARTAAAECRMFAARLDRLGPYSGEPPPIHSV